MKYSSYNKCLFFKDKKAFNWGLLFIALFSLTTGAVASVGKSLNDKNCLLELTVSHSLADKSVAISKCGVEIVGQKAHLTKDIECTQENMEKYGAAISLNHASLNLNGKNIIYKEEKQEGIAISMHNSSEVFDDKNAGKIKGFHTGINVLGDHHNLCNFTVSNTIYGINAIGNDNSFSQIKAKDIGGIIDQPDTTLVAEGKGLIIWGDNNQLTNNETKNIGYDAAQFYEEIKSMYVYAKGIEVIGHHNSIENHNAENIFAYAYSIDNAQVNVNGIHIEGNSNKIEHSSINKVHGTGKRINAMGVQTGAMVMGIFLSNAPGDRGENNLNSNKINDIFSQASRDFNSQQAIDIKAEAYGILAIYNNHKITNNTIEQVDVIAEIFAVAAGIRLADQGHYVADNISRDHGKRSINLPTSAFIVAGISIGSTDTQVKHNHVEDNQGSGIQGSIYSNNNDIRFNTSISNTNYDFLEVIDDENPVECRNNWENNKLESATFSPEICFVN